MMESLVVDPYLPPIISLSDSVARAKAVWRAVKPPYISVSKSSQVEELGGEIVADDTQPPIE